MTLRYFPSQFPRRCITNQHEKSPIEPFVICHGDDRRLFILCFHRRFEIFILRQQVNHISRLVVLETRNLAHIIAHYDINAKTILFGEDDRMFTLIFLEVNRLEVRGKLLTVSFAKPIR